MQDIKYRVIKVDPVTGTEYIQNPDILEDPIIEVGNEEECLNIIEQLKLDEKYSNYEIRMQVVDYNEEQLKEQPYVIAESELPRLPVVGED